eukprot:8707336-Pyramimonas_sp.AAC.1
MQSVEVGQDPIQLAGEVADAVHVAMLSHGFLVNYKKSKSAMFIIPSRQAPVDLRDRLDNEDELLIIPTRCDIQVHVVKEYKYLGTMINRRLEMGPRIAHLVQKQKIAAMP